MGDATQRVMNVGMCCMLWVALLATLSAATTTTTTTTTTVTNTTSPTENPPHSPDISFSNVTLRKCECGRNEVWFTDQCVAYATSISCYSLNGPFERSTSDFGTVTVGKPECKDGFTFVSLPLDSYVLLMSDDTIYWEKQDIFLQDYCLEHEPYGGGSVVMVGRGCVPLPSVPQCCPEGYIVGDDGSCLLYGDDAIFEPTVMINEKDSVRGWGFVNDTVETTCSEDDNEVTRVTHLTLNSKDITLTYAYPQASLELGIEVMFSDQKDYCVGLKRNGDSNEFVYVAKVCASDRKLEHDALCSDVTCVRKCCPNGTLFLGAQCIDAYNKEEIWQPVFHDHRNPSAVVVPHQGDFRFVYGPPLCRDPMVYEVNGTDADKVYLLTNGLLLVNNGSITFPASDYCMDLILQSDFSVSGIALTCSSKPDEECRWRHILILVLFGVSSVFLVATVLIYLGVPELRDRTNGRCLVSLAVAMVATYINLTVISLLPNLTDAECRTAVFMGHVGSLAIFFWLNVMCFDMWSTLRSSKQQYHSLKRFGAYSLYAWGSSFLVGVVAMVLDLTQPEGVIVPGFTVGTCWFTNNAEYWLYLSGIILILVACNIFFFIHVAISLGRKMQKRRRVFEGRSDMTTTVRQQAGLYAKLFIVMGVTWIVDVISSFQHRRECKIWVLADIINASQGVFIFFVAICNKDNLKKIRTAWQPRVDSVRRSVSVLKGGSKTTTSAQHNKNLSVDMSDTSRKTSVTSLPRKLSAVSNILFSTGNNKHHLGGGGGGSGGGSGANERRGSESPSARKYSSVSTHPEQIIMNTLDE